MARVITFSRTFPAYHPRAGEPTFFVEKFWASHHLDFDHKAIAKQLLLIADNCFNGQEKHHTIRAGHRFKVGDKFSPRVWSGKPYNSKQIIIAPDVEIKKVWDFEMVTQDDDGENDWSFINFLGGKYTAYGYGNYDSELMVTIAKNDGLTIKDFYDWLQPIRTKKQKLENEDAIFEGQIICWNENVNY